jgi:hypothetical protein
VRVHGVSYGEGCVYTDTPPCKRCTLYIYGVSHREECRMPPLRYWLFTPELQWQPRGQTAYLTGRAGSAVTLPSRHSSHQRYACLSPLAQWLCEIRVRYVSPCEIRRIRTVCILHGEGWLYIPTPLPVRYTLCRSWFTCRQTSLSYREVIYAPSPPPVPSL